MEYIIILNFLLNIGIIAYLINPHFPFMLEVNKTFWYKKPFSITIWMITSGKRKTGYSAKGLFTIPFRNSKKINAWDDEEFKKSKNRFNSN